MNNTAILDAYNEKTAEKATSSVSVKVTYSTLFWLFMIGSVMGVILEGVWCVWTKGTWENHVATVWGPFCIIYGIGAMAVYLISVWLKGRNILLQFLLFSVSGALVEYLSSLFQEAVFGSTSWDYSADFMNIGGRVSLQMTLIWGALGVLFVRFAFPILTRLFRKTQSKPWKIACIVLTVFMAVNLLVTAAAVARWHSRIMDDSPANNAVEQYLDEHYDNNTMRKIFVNMVFSE